MNIKCPVFITTLNSQVRYILIIYNVEGNTQAFSQIQLSHDLYVLKTPVQTDKGQLEDTRMFIFSTNIALASVTCLTNIT